MDFLLGAVGKALLGLAGPVANWALKKRADRSADRLLQNLEGESGAATKLARAVRADLKQVGLKDEDLVDFSRWVRSPAGEHAMRLIALYATMSARVPAIQDALRDQVHALMLLDGREASRWAEPSAPVVVEHIYETARQLLLAVRRQDRVLAQTIESSAAELRRSNDLLDARQLHNRTDRLASIPREHPSTVVSVVNDYARLVQEETADLSIPTPRKHLTATLQGAYVRPNIAVREGDRLTLHHDVHLLELVEEHPRLLVFGEPGGGKSTTVQACVNALARSTAEDDSMAAVPLRVTLRHFGRKIADDPQAGLFQWILDDLRKNYVAEFSSSTLSYLLHTGRAVLFFDGLDEVLSVDVRREVVKKIWLFARGFPACNYVVTTREPGYDEAPFAPSAGLTDAIIQPLTLAQVEAYSAWFLEDLPPTTHQDLSVRHFLVDSQVVADIRANPLMLGVLCSLYAAGKSMPNDRSELYTRCAEMLFNEWDSGRRIRVPISDPVAAELAVRQLALEIFESGREEIPENRLIQLLTKFYEVRKGQDFVSAGHMAQETLRHWRGRKWLLISAGHDRGDELFRFAHRTFLEFFAAEQTAFLVSGNGKKLAKRLLPYMEVRASIPFVLLTLQISSRSNRGVAEDFIARTIKYVNASEAQSPRVSFNLLLCLVDGLGVLDVGAVVERRPVVKRVLDFVAAHLPPANDSPSQQYAGAYCYADVWHDEGATEEGLDLSWVTGRGDVTVGSLSLLLGGMESVRADERPALVKWLRELLAAPAALDLPLQSWLRLLLFVYFAPKFEDWTRTDSDWASAVRSLAESLVAERSRVSIREGDLEDCEFWLVVLLLKENLSDDPRFLRWIGVEGLFISGTQYPIVESYRPDAGAEGTIAHQYVERLLGSAPFDGHSLEQALSASLANMSYGWLPNRDYFGVKTLAVMEGLAEGACAGLLTPEARFCLAYLTLALVHHGDSESVRTVDAVLARQNHAMAETMRDLLAAELDPESTERSSTLTKKLGLTAEMASRIFELRSKRGYRA